MNEEIKPENMRIHSRADELIACLEGEIAKRDEELAACRVSVENCELFRARIAELEDDLKCAHSMLTEVSKAGMALRAELAAIKAQEPTGWYTEDHLDDKSATTYSKELADRWVAKGWPVFPLYAAPVSEAKAQGVVMPEGWIPLTIEHEPGYPEDVAFGPKRMMDRLKKGLDRYFEMRLNAAPVQQVSVPVWMASARAFADRLYMAGWRDHSDAQHSGVAGMYDELLSSSPAAPAADAGVTDHDQ